MKNIIFTNASGFDGIEKPKPASAHLPDWYKSMQSYTEDKKKPNGFGGTTGTIKKCMPVFDAITAGYILTLPADIYVSKTGFEWANFDLIQYHPVEQAPTHPAGNGLPYPKFMNPWSIKTPKGYSILLIEPMHRDLPFNVLPGIIDTDKYPAPINVIFSMKDLEFEGIIPKGTPFAQVIPFKRETWMMKIGNAKDLQHQKEIFMQLRTKFFDGYKTMFRSDKQYK